MVYKKYFEKNGKKYGPYFYENKRVGQKIVTNYLGTQDPSMEGSKKFSGKKKVFAFAFMILAVVFSLIFLDIFLQFSSSGWLILNLQPAYETGDSLGGKLDLSFNGGELIPSGTSVYVSLGEQKKVFSLSELVDKETTNGDFYASNSFISGSGDGYGLIGKKISYPTVNFKLHVYSSEGGSGDNIDNGGNEGSSDFNNGNNEITPEVPVASNEENIAATDESGSTSSDSDSSSSDSSFDSSSGSDSASADSSSSDSSGFGITGEVVSEQDYVNEESVNGKKSYSFTLGESEDFEIVEGSIVGENGEELGDVLEIEKEGNKVTISTDYLIEEEGFGKDYITSDKSDLPIDLSKLGITAENSTLEIKLVYQDNIITSIKKKILAEGENAEEIVEEKVIENITNINASIINLIKDIPTIRLKVGESVSLNLNDYFENAGSYGFNVNNLTGIFEGDILTLSSDEGFKGARKARVIAYAQNEVLESNEFSILVSSGAVNIYTIRSSIKVGEEVKWQANISLEFAENVSIILPVQAENISVSKIDEQGEKEIGVEIIKTIDGSPEIISSIEKSSTSELDVSSRGFLTGDVVANVSLNKKSSFIIDFFKNSLRNLIKFTGFAVDDIPAISDSGSDNTEINIASLDDATNYIVEYTTPAPIAIESNSSYGKQVIVSAPSELNYTDVLSFTNIPEIYSVGQESSIKIYWVENKSYVNFDAYDLDGNEKLDYVEWITPHLSNQTFEIILIIKAEHLDASRNFI